MGFPKERGVKKTDQTSVSLEQGFFGIPCGTKFLREFHFADGRLFCVLQELTFAIRWHCFFLLGISFLRFEESRVQLELHHFFYLFLFLNEYMQLKYR